jgi:hypothetical protein
MTKSPPITITSTDLREQVEEQLGGRIPDKLWNRAEPYARRKLNINRERTPEVDYYDNMYLVLLTADTVKEMDFSDYTLARSMAIMASRAEMKGATI